MGPQSPEDTLPPPSSQGAVPQVEAGSVPDAHAAGRKMLEETMAQLRQQAPETPDIPQSDDISSTPTADEEAKRQALLAIADEQIRQAEAHQVQNELPSQSPVRPILPAQNKSLIAMVFEQIKNVITAPARAFNWAKTQVQTRIDAFAGRVNTLFKPRSNPPQSA
ncbi:MAG: hypothetical protein V1922_05870 [bacterium]